MSGSAPGMRARRRTCKPSRSHNHTKLALLTARGSPPGARARRGRRTGSHPTYTSSTPADTALRGGAHLVRELVAVGALDGAVQHQHRAKGLRAHHRHVLEVGAAAEQHLVHLAGGGAGGGRGMRGVWVQQRRRGRARRQRSGAARACKAARQRRRLCRMQELPRRQRAASSQPAAHLDRQAGAGPQRGQLSEPLLTGGLNTSRQRAAEAKRST